MPFYNILSPRHLDLHYQYMRTCYRPSSPRYLDLHLQRIWIYDRLCPRYLWQLLQHMRICDRLCPRCLRQLLPLLPRPTPMVSIPNYMQSALLPKPTRVHYVVPRPIGRKASTTVWICKTSPCTKGISLRQRSLHRTHDEDVRD